jgi:hypothetical protein
MMVKVPRADSRSTRTRRSASAITAASGGAGEAGAGRPVISTSLLYSLSGSVTVRVESAARGGACPAAGDAMATTISAAA